jgi:hypothetical protein
MSDCETCPRCQTKKSFESAFENACEDIDEKIILTALNYPSKKLCQDVMDWVFGSGLLQDLFSKYNVYMIAYSGLMKTRCGKSKVEFMFRKIVN